MSGNREPLSPLRRLPALAALSSAASLLIVVPAGNLQTITGSIVCLSGALFLLSLFVEKKAWSLRTASSVLSGGSIGALVTARPDYLAVLGALMPLFLLVLLYGAPFSRASTGPGWQRSGIVRVSAPRHHPPTKVLGAIDSYLILAQAVVFQFTEQESGVVLISFVLSAVAVLTIAAVAAGIAVDASRKALRATGLASQVYMAAVDDGTTAVRILGGVVCGIYAIPATL